MANESKTKSTADKQANWTPFIIIGLIFVATIAGIYLITQSGADADGTSVSNTSGSNGATNTGANGPQPLPNYGTAPPGATPAHFKGSEGAPVIVEEFADFQCPTCAVVHPRMNEINSRFGSRIKFVFRNYPLTTIHRNSYDAAIAAEAAGFQNKFWEMQNLIFQNQTQWSSAAQPRPIFEEYATRIGLDLEKFKNDMLGFATKGRVDEDMRRARALNITSTPTILVNGKPAPSLETAAIAQLVESELARFDNKEEAPTAGGQNSNAANSANENK